MNYTITESTAFPIVEIALQQGENITIDSGSMVYHNGKVSLSGKINSNGKSGITGILSALGRSVSSGEGFWETEVTGSTNEAKISLAPDTPGTIKTLSLSGTSWYLNTGAFLASDKTVSYTMKRQKVSGAVFGGTGGLYVMETTGTGDLLINSYGDIIELDITDDTPMVIDNEHVVAWSSSLDYNIKIASGLLGFKTGEGLVNEFHGTGKVLIQTRKIKSLVESLSPLSDD